MKKIIVLTRHGQRIDSSFFKHLQIFPENDPELTIKGREQAYEIGLKLKEYFISKYNIHLSHNNYSLISSPYSRTIQTSKEILKSLKLFNYKINIDNSFSECSYYWIMSCLPINFLSLYKKSTQDKFYNQFEEFENEKIETENPLTLDNLPKKYETESEILNRSLNGLYNIIDKKLDDYDVIHIISHAGILAILRNFLFLNNKLIDYSTFQYCDTIIFEISNVNNIEINGTQKNLYSFSYLDKLSLYIN